MTFLETLPKPILDRFPYQPIEEYLIALCRSGSTTYGTDMPELGSDIDYMGVYMPPINVYLGLGGQDQWGPSISLEDNLDCTIFSLQKLVHMLLKQNPNVMPLLWVDEKDVLYKTWIFDALRDIREAFNSKRGYNAFRGYAKGQLYDITRLESTRKLGAKRKLIIERFGYNTYAASHTIRLITMAIEYMESHVYRIDRTNIDADVLKDIKQGKWSVEQVQQYAEFLLNTLDISAKHSTLPDEPDTARVEQTLIDIMLTHINLTTTPPERNWNV